MHQSELNRQVAHAMGEDIDFIACRGFSLASEQLPQEDDELMAQMIDWDQLQEDQGTALFRDRQPHQAA